MGNLNLKKLIVKGTPWLITTYVAFLTLTNHPIEFIVRYLDARICAGSEDVNCLLPLNLGMNLIIYIVIYLVSKRLIGSLIK